MLVGLASMQAILYAWIAAISPQFDFDIPVEHRPIPFVLGLFGVCFLLHLISLKVVLRLQNTSLIVAGVLVVAAAFRVTLLYSHPIQEVDIYRYLWDGATSTAGVNPFRYSPQHVLASDTRADLPNDLQQLVSMRDNDPALLTVLERVHFGELTTVYPPVSQAVFAVTATLTPASATVLQRITVMKGVLLTFDFATIIFMLLLLRLTGRHWGWSVVYAWSPLVLKEFANSGHLDSIAVCLTTASLCCWLQGMRSTRQSGIVGWAVLASTLLGLGIGAKLYPIVLMPIVVRITHRRMSWREAAFVALPGIVLAATLLAPMLLTKPATLEGRDSPTLFGPDAHARKVSSALSDVRIDSAEQRGQASGLITFLTQWEINDLLFMVLLENVRPKSKGHSEPSSTPWFVVVPDQIRSVVFSTLFSRIWPAPSVAAFVVIRIVTLVIFLLIALSCAKSSQLAVDPVRWLEGCFLTLAWFWTLSPTMNPWYWIWALPLLPFTRSRAWLAVSGLLFLYYFRFWLAAHYAGTPVFGTGYRGEQFFHFFIVPIEHGVWLVWLAIDAWNLQRNTHLTPLD